MIKRFGYTQLHKTNLDEKIELSINLIVPKIDTKV